MVRVTRSVGLDFGRKSQGRISCSISDTFTVIVEAKVSHRCQAIGSSNAPSQTLPLTHWRRSVLTSRVCTAQLEALQSSRRDEAGLVDSSQTRQAVAEVQKQLSETLAAKAALSLAISAVVGPFDDEDALTARLQDFQVRPNPQTLPLTCGPTHE